MKPSKRIRILLIASLLGVFGLGFWARWRPAIRFEPVVPADSHFRVVTWNVGYFAPVTDKNLKDVDLQIVADVLYEIHADVIVLQELAREEQALILRDLLGESWKVYAVETGHRNQVMAILTSLEGGTPDVQECGGRKTLGISLITGNDHPVYVLGVHAPHPARGIQENEENIRCALNWVDSRTEPVRILTGDLNYNFDPDSGSDFYLEILESFGDGTLEMGETYYARTRIDHFFHFPKDLDVVQEESGMVDLPLRFANVPGFRDHRPLVVTYDLK